MAQDGALDSGQAYVRRAAELIESGESVMRERAHVYALMAIAVELRLQ